MHSTLSRRRFLGSTTVALTTGSLLQDAVAADEEVEDAQSVKDGFVGAGCGGGRPQRVQDERVQQGSQQE